MTDSLRKAESSEPAYEETFNELALELFAFQCASNPVLNRLCQARGLRPGSSRRPGEVTSWREIPAVPTSVFKEMEVTCLAPEERTLEFHSSGTTAGAHSRVFHNRDSLALYEESLWAWFEHCVVGRVCPHTAEVGPVCPHTAAPCLIFLTPRTEQAPNSSLVHMFETVRERSGNPKAAFFGHAGPHGWELDLPAAVESLSQASRRERPVLVLGTAFSFVHLLDGLRDRGMVLRLPPGSMAFETGGYKGRSRSMTRGELHAGIRSTLGVEQVVSEYGMAELASQAYAGPCGAGQGGDVFRFPPWARAMVVSPETGQEVKTGETGLVRVLDVANVASAMVVQTEDLAVKEETGFRFMGRAPRAEARGCSLNVASGGGDVSSPIVHVASAPGNA